MNENDLISFYNFPGVFTIIHGDMSLSNFVIDEKTDELFLIDISGIMKNSKNNDFFGLPGYDYYQFISSIYWKITDKIKCDELIKGFSEGYGSIEMFNKSKEIFIKYWNIMNFNNMIL